MKPLKVLFLRGPNIWRTGPVLEAWIDCGQLAQAATLPPGEMMERLFHSWWQEIEQVTPNV